METDSSPRVLLRQGDEHDIPMDDDPTEARRVRREVADVLGPLTADVGRIQDVLVAVSELVSNALVHGGPPRLVRLSLTSGGLMVRVFDGSPHQPHLVHPGRSEPGGRGLELVSRLSTSWGTEPRSDGKWVWCLVGLSREPLPDATARGGAAGSGAHRARPEGSGG